MQSIMAKALYHPSSYEDIHYKDKTVVRPSYLYDGDPYTWIIFILRRPPGGMSGIVVAELSPSCCR